MATRKTKTQPSASRPAPTAAEPGAPITFVLRGAIEASAAATRGASAPSLPAGLARGQVKHALRMTALRGGASSAETRVQAVPGRDVVVLHVAGGPSLVLHPESARDLMLAQQAGRPRSRGAAADAAEVSVPAQLAWPGLDRPQAGAADARAASRGAIGDALLSGLEIITGVAGDALAEGAAVKLAARVDAQVEPGLYALSAAALPRLKGSGQKALTTLAAAQAAEGPLLVFIHGTFSNTAGAFGKLWTQHPQRVAGLFQHYGERVYALEHPTLQLGPVANALALAQALPKGARLHLVTHSRGGLVAEVLARVAANPSLAGEDLGAFSAAERSELAALGNLLGRKGVRVERVVRVACPARGTLLASKRLDAYLSVFKWTLELAAVPVLPELVDFLAAVAQQRTDPDTLPGLAAQVPDSALIQWLHAAAEPLPGELRVVAGDVQGDSVGSWLKTLVADSFYWTDNDFVVQTRSMYGGAPRSGGALYLLDRGGRVAHGEYFGNERTAAAVCSALMQAQPEGFGLIGPLSWSGDSATGTRGARGRKLAGSARRGDSAPDDSRTASDKPAAILLPGIAGSHLAVDGQRIWLSLRLVGGLKRLAYPDAPGHTVQADGAIGPVYDELAAYLAQSHEVIEFSYDWRRPIEDEARRLASVAEAALAARAQSSQPVRFVAHSMGGLVVRSMALQAPALWTALLARRGARVLMLGTPNGGSWAPMQVLSGDDTFGNTLTAFGAPFQDHAARQLMARMPGFLQLQAALSDGQRQLDREATWQALADADLKAVNEYNRWHSEQIQLNAYRWGVPPQAVLDAAKAFREALDRQREHDLPRYADKLLLVVGKARFTPDGYELGNQGLDYLNASDSGDGRVTRESALLPGVRSWAVDCEHGALADHEQAFAGYAELLDSGSTADPALTPLPLPLPDVPSGTQRGLPAAALAPPVALVRGRPSRRPQALRPPEHEAELGASAMPSTREAPRDSSAGVPALAVGVVNGNLMFMRQPLLIGHYSATQLSGTEWVLNGLIGGGMQAALAAGIYPDAPGSHRMFRHTGQSDNPLQLPRPEWAIVVGLGDESELEPSQLVHSVRQAIIGWAQRIVEQPDGAPATFELAATLIGSGGTRITPGQSAQLIAQAGREANQTLAACGWPLLAGLQLVELYLDRASEAWRGLQVHAAAAPNHWRIAAHVKAGAGALRRPLEVSYRGADYDLISAESRGGQDSRSGEATIAYTLDTKRARAELRSQATQAGLVRELVKRASSERNRDPQIGRSLYQLLIPAEMDPFLGGTTEMRIKLDRGTAGIPWELLQDNRSAGGDQRPWSIRTKLMRSLITAQFRRQVRDANRDGGVLVIGEPALPPGSGYGRLPGARAEAQAVADCFGGPAGQAGREAAGVRALIAEDDRDPRDSRDGHTAPDAQQVINALLERDWQVVHIAGHGAAPERIAAANGGDEADGATRGVVLSHGFLGPNEINAMRTVPELVFVNCCFLAERNAAQLFSGPANLVQFASTVADALINIGVRCVIAAGWAVEDGPAEIFATTFYAALLRGRRFIDAAAQAREKAWEANPEGNTWAAYQCYGDPNWTLSRGSAAAPGATPAERFAGVSSPLGLALALETVAIDARYVRGHTEADRERGRQTQRQRLAHLEGRFAPLWGGMGAVAEAFAVAASELADIDAAIAWYQRALQANDGSATQKAAEQSANLRVRRASDHAAAAQDALRSAVPGKRAPGQVALAKVRHQARREIRTALASIENLIGQQPTMERESLAGSACKRLATIESDAGREREALAAISRMKRHYAAAEHLARLSAEPDVFYPALNRLAAELAADAARPGWPGFDASALAVVRQSLADKTRDDPDFWSVVGLTDLRLYEAVAARALAPVAASLTTEYAELHRRVAAPRDWRSVHDSARFVLERYARRATAAERTVCSGLLAVLQHFAWPTGA